MTWKTWEKKGKRGVTRLLARALRRQGTAGPVPDFADLSSILLIRTQNQLGDMLLATPALRAIRERAPRARIDIVVSPANVDAVIGSPRFNEILVFDKRVLWKRPSAARAFVSRLRNPRYDLALVLSSVDFSTTSVWLAAISGASRRAGRPGSRTREREIADEFFDWVLAPSQSDRHQSASYLDLVAVLGAMTNDSRPEIFPLPGEGERGRRALDDAIGPRGKSARVVIHPGAGKIPNRWDARRFGEVAACLVARGERVAVASGPRERDLLNEMDRGAGAHIPRLPTLGVRELAAAIGAADLFIANDTGVLHLGAAAGAWGIGLFGPTDPSHWCPSSPRIGTIRAPEGDLAHLPTTWVAEAAIDFLRHERGEGVWPAALTPAPLLVGRAPS